METDHTLLNAARRLEGEALMTIFDVYASPLFRYALHLCGDPVLADHIVGDVFAKLLEQFSAGNGPTEHLRSYLYKTTHHRTVDEARYASRRVPLEMTDWLRPVTDPASPNLEEQILFKQVLHAIRYELTDNQRHVIVLRFLEDFSLRETAAIVGKTVEHVKVIQSRAISALRKSLEHRGIRKPFSSQNVTNFSSSLGI
jgi:RNA polymerase sigma-70 factor (ECF subfamily)